MALVNFVLSQPAEVTTINPISDTVMNVIAVFGNGMRLMTDTLGLGSINTPHDYLFDALENYLYVNVENASDLYVSASVLSDGDVGIDRICRYEAEAGSHIPFSYKTHS